MNVLVHVYFLKIVNLKEDIYIKVSAIFVLRRKKHFKLEFVDLHVRKTNSGMLTGSVFVKKDSAEKVVNVFQLVNYLQLQINVHVL